MRQDIQSALPSFFSPLFFFFLFFCPPHVWRLQLLCGFKNSVYSPKLKFLGGEVVTKLQFTEGKANLRLEVHVSSVNSVNSYSSFFFFSSLPCPPNEDGFFQKPRLYSSSIIVHSHYSIRLNLPLNENEDFSTGKSNIFWFSEYVDPDLFNRDRLSTWRQTIITDTAHEGIHGLAAQSEWIIKATLTSAELW